MKKPQPPEAKPGRESDMERKSHFDSAERKRLAEKKKRQERREAGRKLEK